MQSAVLTDSSCYHQQSLSWGIKGLSNISIAWIISACLILIPIIEGGCTWPSDFAGTTWYDNRHGTAVFDSADGMTGWTIEWVGAGGTTYTMNQWECLDMSGFANGAGGNLVFKSVQSFRVLGEDWNIYQCLDFTYLTKSSYLYYKQHSTQVLVNNERVQVSLTTNVLTRLEEVCNTDTTVPATEFQVMVKSGTESHAKRDCTSQMFTRSDYTHTAADGTVTCDTSTDNWDVCTDRGIMTFNYSSCNTEMAYSAAGLVYCVFSLTSGSSTHQMVFNSDSAPTYRFACFVINSGGTAASMVYNYCRSSQTPTSLANNGTNNIGALLKMEPFSYPSDTITDTVTDTVPSTVTDTVPDTVSDTVPDTVADCLSVPLIAGMVAVGVVVGMLLALSLAVLALRLTGRNIVKSDGVSDDASARYTTDDHAMTEMQGDASGAQGERGQYQTLGDIGDNAHVYTGLAEQSEKDSRGSDANYVNS